MKLKTKLSVGQKIEVNNISYVVDEIRILVNYEVNINYLLKNLKNDKWLDLDERNLESK